MTVVRPPTGTRIDVVFTKWDGSLHWHGPSEMLGSDEFGTWLAVRSGFIWRKGAGGDPKPFQDSVFLIPDRLWWLASFPLDDPKESLYVDVATPVVWHGNEARMVDLDLDVLRSVDGDVRLVDEDEFEMHSRVLGYPPDVVDGARATAARLMVQVGAGEEPFGAAAGSWMTAIG